MSENVFRAVETFGTATKATISAYTAGFFTAVGGWLASVDWVAVAGVASIIGTFLVNWYYKDRDLRRQERNDVEMQRIRAREVEIQSKLLEANLQPAPRDNG